MQIVILALLAISFPAAILTGPASPVTISGRELGREGSFFCLPLCIGSGVCLVCLALSDEMIISLSSDEERESKAQYRSSNSLQGALLKKSSHTHTHKLLARQPRRNLELDGSSTELRLKLLVLLHAKTTLFVLEN